MTPFLCRNARASDEPPLPLKQTFDNQTKILFGFAAVPASAPACSAKRAPWLLQRRERGGGALGTASCQQGKTRAVGKIWARVCCQSVSRSVGLQTCRCAGRAGLPACIRLTLARLLSLVAKVVVGCELNPSRACEMRRKEAGKPCKSQLQSKLIPVQRHAGGWCGRALADPPDLDLRYSELPCLCLIRGSKALEGKLQPGSFTGELPRDDAGPISGTSRGAPEGDPRERWLR